MQWTGMLHLYLMVCHRGWAGGVPEGGRGVLGGLVQVADLVESEPKAVLSGVGCLEVG